MSLGEDVNKLLDFNNNDSGDMISLMVYNSQNGEKVFEGKIQDSKKTLDSSGWKHGIYIIKVVIGKEVLSEKVIVQ